MNDERFQSLIKAYEHEAKHGFEIIEKVMTAFMLPDSDANLMNQLQLCEDALKNNENLFRIVEELLSFYKDGSQEFTDYSNALEAYAFTKDFILESKANISKHFLLVNQTSHTVN